MNEYLFVNLTGSFYCHLKLHSKILAGKFVCFRGMRLHGWHIKNVFISTNGIVLPQIEHITLNILSTHTVLANYVFNKSEINCDTFYTDVIPVDCHSCIVVLACQLKDVLRSTENLDIILAIIDAMCLV